MTPLSCSSVTRMAHAARKNVVFAFCGEEEEKKRTPMVVRRVARTIITFFEFGISRACQTSNSLRTEVFD